jgi:arginase
MRIRFISVPYDTAQFERRMGCGPGRILEGGAIERLQALGHDVEVVRVDLQDAFPAEVATAFAVMSAVAELVRAARAEACFPIVLAGNCNTTVGSVSGLHPRRAGVVWFDGHADFETPQTTASGFVDGMGLAILTGQCWQKLAQDIPGFAALPGGDVVLAGANDVEPHEKALLEALGVTYLADRDLNGEDGTRRLAATLDRLCSGVDGIHLHIDLDVHDPKLARANHFLPPGGLSPARLHEAVAQVAARVPLLSAAITAYDPEFDPAGVTLASCLTLLETVASSGEAG